DLVAKSGAWPRTTLPGAHGDRTPAMASIAARNTRPPSSAARELVRTTRQTFLRDWTARAPGAHATELWIHGWAEGVVDEADAHEAIAALSAYPEPEATGLPFDDAVAVGRAYALG